MDKTIKKIYHIIEPNAGIVYKKHIIAKAEKIAALFTLDNSPGKEWVSEPLKQQEPGEPAESQEELRPGLYQHYKGNLYSLLFIGILEKDLSEVAIYMGQDGKVWVRSMAEFKEKFEIKRKEK